MVRSLLVIWLSIYGIVSSWTQDHHAGLQQVLDDLYQTFGNYQFERPRVVVSDSDVMGAGFIQARNEIMVESKLLDVCSQLGSDSLAAIYFILGHELTHFYQKALTHQEGATNFLAHSEHQNASYRMERDADLQGAFLTYLCGYDIDPGLPQFINELYRTYQLDDAQLPGYPTKRKRLHTIRQTLDLHKRMVTLYDNSIALMILGQYELAREGFRSLQEYYQGYEIHYNIGLTALLEAIYFPARNVDPYLFPIEIQASTRMHKPDAIEGDKDLNLDDMWQREILLNMAKTSFVEVQRIHPTFIPAYLGFAIVMTLENHYDAAKRVLERTLSIPGGKQHRYVLMLVEGIIEALKGNHDTAREVFMKVEAQGKPALQHLARMNLSRLGRESWSDTVQWTSKDQKQDKMITLVPPEAGPDPIMLINGTKVYKHTSGESTDFTYFGNRRSLILNRKRVDFPWVDPGEDAIWYRANNNDYIVFPETASYWKVWQDRILEIGKLKSDIE